MPWSFLPKSLLLALCVAALSVTAVCASSTVTLQLSGRLDGVDVLREDVVVGLDGTSPAALPRKDGSFVLAVVFDVTVLARVYRSKRTDSSAASTVSLSSHRLVFDADRVEIEPLVLSVIGQPIRGESDASWKLLVEVQSTTSSVFRASVSAIAVETKDGTWTLMQRDAEVELLDLPLGSLPLTSGGSGTAVLASRRRVFEDPVERFSLWSLLSNPIVIPMAMMGMMMLMMKGIDPSTRKEMEESMSQLQSLGQAGGSSAQSADRQPLQLSRADAVSLLNPFDAPGEGQ